MVVFPPDRIPIRGEHQCIADGIQVQSPIRTVDVLRVAKRAEIFGVAAARLPILGLDGEGVNAVDGYFHGLNLLVGLLTRNGSCERQDDNTR